MRESRFSKTAIGQRDSNKILRWFIIHKTPRSFRYAARVTKASDISDIIQDVYVSILSTRKNLDYLNESTVLCKHCYWHMLSIFSQFKKMGYISKEDLPEVECESEPLVEHVWKQQLRVAVRKAVKTLTYLQMIVIQLRFGLCDGHCYSYSQVGRIIGKSKNMARLIEIKAIRKLQENCRSRMLDVFFRDNI